MKKFIPVNDVCFAILHDPETKEAWLEPVVSWFLELYEDEVFTGDITIDHAHCIPVLVNHHLDEIGKRVLGVYHQSHRIYQPMDGAVKLAAGLLDALDVASKYHEVWFVNETIDFACSQK